MAPKVKTKGSRHNPPLTHDRCFPSPGPHNSPPLSPHIEHISHPRFPHLSKALQAAFLSRVGPHKQTQSAEPFKQLLKDVGGSLERWNQKWRRSLDGWWGGVPGGGVMERCGAFLSGVLASRFQSWIGRNRLSGGAVAPPPAPTNDVAGCEEALTHFSHMSQPTFPISHILILYFGGARGVAAARVPRERWRGGEATLLGASRGAHPAPPPFPAPCWRAAPMGSPMGRGRADGDGGRRRRSRWVAQSPLGRRWVFSECADECILRDGACEIWELGAAQGA